MDFVISLARTYVQAGVGALVAWLLSAGVSLPDGTPGFLEAFVWALVVAATMAALRYLETRRGDGFWPTVARRAAALVMLGLSTRQPSYPRRYREHEPQQG